MTGVGAILAACHVAAAEDRPGCPSSLWDVIHDAFVHLPESEAVPFGKQIADLLFESSQRTGSFKAWAAALYHLPRPGMREASAWLGERLDAWAVSRSTQPIDDRRRRLAKLAVQLVRDRVPSAHIIKRLDIANATLPDPLPGEVVHDVALWAARVARGHDVA